MLSAVIVLTALATLASAQGNQIFSVAANNAGKKACITASSTDNGTPVTVAECGTLESNVVNQEWLFSQDSKFPVGPQQFRFSLNTNKCLDVVDGRDADGAKLQIWDCVDGSKNQLFDYHNWSWTGGNNKCIDLTDGNSSDGTQLQLWSCSGGPNQDWAIQGTPRQRRLTTWVATSTDGTSNGMCLTAESNTDGAPVILAPCGDFTVVPNGNRTWSYPVPTAGAFQVYDRTKCLDIKDGNKENGSQLQIWTCSEGSANQQFNYGLGTIVLAGTNKCLDIAGKTKVTGARIELQECTGTLSDGQFWHDI